MKILVQKFGGTSVANLECMKKVREKVQAGLNKGYKMVVVLSARSGETNRLLALASEWSSTPDPAECDSLVSTGEQVSIALFTMLLKDAGIRARSLLAWQIPIITDDDHGNARIESIDSQRLRSYLDEYDVLVVAGFQGCTESQRITTLGRGGCPGCRPGFGGMRDLHGCGRRLYHRPQHLLQRPQDGSCRL